MGRGVQRRDAAWYRMGGCGVRWRYEGTEFGNTAAAIAARGIIFFLQPVVGKV